MQPRSLETLIEVEKLSNVVVDFLLEQLGLNGDAPRRSAPPGQEREQRVVVKLGSVIELDNANSMGKSFRRAKRLIDVFGVACLMFAVIPIAALISIIVALDVGFPIIFWQQRPGLRGRPFKLYKFRTMCAPRDKDKRRLSDDQRSSAIGRTVRRFRLDELPQLYNVLVGDMSLVGPRPLLPCDQDPNYSTRLSMRPGITGWAQVNGGRIISPSDKFILDIWYTNNASVLLDLKIVLSTVKIFFFGDRINNEAVNQARSDLSLQTPLRAITVPAE
jgi:lipopolysaccharide/colanic/teichoic acid biosynthesis glycosyltransferase